MAYRIEYVNTFTGTTYNLNSLNGTTGIDTRYLGDIGFGLSPLHHITARGPMMDGDVYVDYRLDPRVIQLPLLIRPGTAVGKTRMERLYYAREWIMGVFNPNHAGYLRYWPEYDLDPTNARYLNTRVLGGLTFDVDPQSPYDFRTVVQLRAADPLWYNNDASQTVTISNAQFGSFIAVTNVGNHRSWPIIQATGPVTNFRITNSQGGTTLAIELNASTTIAAGNTFTFNLQQGVKTVTGMGGANAISGVTAASDFATFAIPSGASSLRCTGTGTTAATSVTVLWTPAYNGV